ncbi:Cyclin-dependent kinase 10 [Rhizophlyctis rosea]|nr:Cyclin-dependent kinase 10 [Rhizophlyctis rosea]
MTPKVVTLWYRAPELLFGEKIYTTAIDMWSAGCIFGELLKNRPLLPGKIEREQITRICELLGTPNDTVWPEFSSLPLAKAVKMPDCPYDSLRAEFKNVNISESGMSLLKQMLIYSPKWRLDVAKALEHAWFRESPRPCEPVFLPTFPEGRNERGEKVANAKRKYDVREREREGDSGRRMKGFYRDEGRAGGRPVAPEYDEADLYLELGAPVVPFYRRS